MAVDNSRLINEAGTDSISNNNRTRATLTNPLGVNYVMGSGTPASINTAGNVTYTTAQMLTGIIVRDCNGSARTDTFPTAALVVAGVNNASAGAVVGDYLPCLIVNGTNATFAITLSPGSGGAFDTAQTAGSQTIPIGTSKYVMLRLTNVTPGAEAYVIYS